MKATATACQFIRHANGEISKEPPSSPEQVRRETLRRITASLLALVPADEMVFSVMVPVSDVIHVDLYRHGYNQPAASRVRAHVSVDGVGGKYIGLIEIEGPDQDIMRPSADYLLHQDGGVVFSSIWAVSNHMMAQISQGLEQMVAHQ